MGGEALRLLHQHPEVELAWATSRTPGPAEHHHPNLFGCGIELIAPEQATPCDLVFVALPTEAAIDATRRQLSAGARVIDLGAGFRLRDRDAWESLYAQEHPAWALAEEAVYGIPELRAGDVAAARLVANPGCFSSAVILGLAPLVREHCIDRERIVVDGLSGTAGAGAELDRILHHPEIGANLVPYNAVGHRHTAEMEQELSAVAGAPVRVHFTPTYVPIVRGILALCHAFPTRRLERRELLALVRDFYADAPFVSAYDLADDASGPWRTRPYPDVSSVAGTNHCFIGLDVDPERGRIVVMSVLDSVGKGGAQVGVENMNLMLGLPRESGLGARGRHPA
jgi:N-acetyl-gamma-glutamyl-phosphate reductase common form